MNKDVKISNHAKEKYKIRCKNIYHFKKLVNICNGMRKGKRSIVKVEHWKNIYDSKCCYFDYKENLVFVFSDTMKRLLTVRDDLGHFNIAKKPKENLIFR